MINTGIGIIRTKAMATLLGPAGFGLAGLYGSIADLTLNIAGLGVNNSGVRQIAEAIGSNDAGRIARTVAALRRTSGALGLLGAALLIVFSRQVSALTFGDNRHAAAISLLSIVVLLRLISAAQGALIQGTRRISDLAKMGLIGALTGTLVSIPTVYFLKEDGVVPSLVGVAAVTMATSWWYSRKIHVEEPSLTGSQLRREAAALLRLGFVFMVSGLMTMGVAYVVRIALLREVGLEGAGLYQSAWTIGGLYVGFILQAMGADFYPRLSASADNNAACNRIVNEQARIGLLLAGPGVIATLTLAPLVISILYSPNFGPAAVILRWICLGSALQVVTWPMGFIIIAKGKQASFFWCEVAWAVVSLALAWVCVKYFGLSGAGIAFFGSYVFHGLMLYPIVRRLSSFSWTYENRRTQLIFVCLIAASFCGVYVLPLYLSSIVGILAAVLGSAYSIRALLNIVASKQLPAPIKKLCARFGYVLSACALLQ